MTHPQRPARTSRRQLLRGGMAFAAGSAIAAVASSTLAVTTTYKYDDLGRVIGVTNADGSQTSYYYDAADNRIQLSTVAPGSATTIQVTAVSNLRTLANNAGYTGAAPGNYIFNVASGVTVTAASGGGLAIDTGTWPAGSTLSLVVSGNIYGGGGTGGAGSNSGGGGNGGSGGDAVTVHAPITVTVNAGGSIKSGGGGGGGGGYTSSGGTIGGDGGGGGFPNGSGGAGSAGTFGDPAVPGNPGTTAGGGTGGSGGPPGGAGGNAGTAGAAGTSGTGTGGSGGAAGYAIRKNANTVIYTNSGTVSGTVG